MVARSDHFVFPAFFIGEGLQEGLRPLVLRIGEELLRIRIFNDLSVKESV